MASSFLGRVCIARWGLEQIRWSHFQDRGDGLIFVRYPSLKQLAALCRRTDHDASKDILHAAKTAMKASGFKAMTSRIISGQEEAAGGWLTANYIMNLPEKVRELGHPLGATHTCPGSRPLSIVQPTQSHLLIIMGGAL